MPWTRSRWRWRTSRFLCPAALLAFVVLKLAGVTNWSWWWALAPAWIPVAALLLLGILAALAFAIVRLVLRVLLRMHFRRAIPLSARAPASSER
jgi:hypothetical protein